MHFAQRHLIRQISSLTLSYFILWKRRLCHLGASHSAWASGTESVPRWTKSSGVCVGRAHKQLHFVCISLCVCNVFAFASKVQHRCMGTSTIKVHEKRGSEKLAHKGPRSMNSWLAYQMNKGNETEQTLTLPPLFWRRIAMLVGTLPVHIPGEKKTHLSGKDKPEMGC